MGASQTKPKNGSIRILNSAEATARLAVPDDYFYACMACSANRQAMQTVEPVAAPAWVTRLHEIKLPTWAPKELEVAFFREGMPHTRGPRPTIWLPLNLPDLERTFLHECAHISQREKSEIWTKIYADAFDARPFEGQIPLELKGRLRLNPDTYGWPHFQFWERWTPVLAFKRPEAPNLGQVRLLYLNALGGWQSSAPHDWMQKIGTDAPHICEHPNELAAYLLTEPGLASLTIREKLMAAISRYMG